MKTILLLFLALWLAPTQAWMKASPRLVVSSQLRGLRPMYNKHSRHSHTHTHSRRYGHREFAAPNVAQIIPKPLKSIDQVETVPSALSAESLLAGPESVRVQWEAAVESFVPLVEHRKHRLLRYLSTQQRRYQTLLGELNVTAISESEFSASIGTVNFFGTKFRPTVYLQSSFDAETRSAVIRINRSEIATTFHADRLNGTFCVQGENTLSTKFCADRGRLLHSRVRLRVDALLPRTTLPENLLKHAGTHVLMSALNSYASPVVKSVAKDYLDWAATAKDEEDSEEKSDDDNKYNPDEDEETSIAAINEDNIVRIS